MQKNNSNDELARERLTAEDVQTPEVRKHTFS